MPTVDHNAPWWEHLAELAADLRQTAARLEAIVSTAALGSNAKDSRSHSPSTAPPAQRTQPSGNGFSSPPIVDRATFSARWEGKTCHLGNTVTFRLLERLARRPNQFVPCDVLLQEVWESRRSWDAVRSAVKVLRQKLTSSGMDGLAAAIDGSTAHHYRLSLNGRF